MDTSFTPQEVADMLKIAKTTVYELIKRGDLNSYRVGNKMRIEMKDIEKYISNKKDNKSQHSLPENNLVNPVEFPLDSVHNNDFIICGQDIMLDILSRHLETYHLETRIYRSYVGSYNGLYSMYTKGASAATTHLWDASTDTYNLTYIKSLLPGIPTVVIHLAKRMQGFYVLKGNPKDIKTWQDLTKPNIIFANREKGSGTRVLLDENLKKLNINSSQINGYSRECTSHLAVASTIARGGADVGIGTQNASIQIKNIDFIPIQEEKYELVIKKEDMNTRIVKSIMEVLNSDIFKFEVLGLGGYDIAEMGNLVTEL